MREIHFWPGQKVKVEGKGFSLVGSIEELTTSSLRIVVQEGAAGEVRGKVKGVVLHEDTIYHFETKVKESSLFHLTLQMPGRLTPEKVSCYRRREKVGVPDSIPLRYEIVQKARGETAKITFPEQGVCQWLGGDKMVLSSVAPIREKTLLAIEFALPGLPEYIRLFGRVSRLLKRTFLHQMEVTFEGMSRKAQDRLMSYLIQAHARRGRVSGRVADLDEPLQDLRPEARRVGDPERQRRAESPDAGGVSGEEDA